MRLVTLFAMTCSLGCGAPPCPEPATAAANESSAPAISAPASTTTPSSTAVDGAEADPILPARTTAEHLAAVRDGQACFAYSKAKEQVACLVLEPLRRGHVEVGTTYLVLFDGQSNEALRLRLDRPGGPPDDFANAILRAGSFVAGGTPADPKAVVAGDNQLFTLEVPEAGKRVGYTKSDKGPGPLGFTGNPHDCMRWIPHGATEFGDVTMVHLRLEHDFTTTPGATCSVNQVAGFPPFDTRRGQVLLH